ncbi:MAG: transposase [bacterium]
MPNHIHGILVITESPVGVMNASPEKYTGRPNGSPLPRGPQQQSIGAIIGSFKSALTKWVNEIGNKSGYTIWQRNYFEHIIRSGEEFNHIREYIRNNPMMWGVDRENLLVNQQFIKNTKRQSWQV